MYVGVRQVDDAVVRYQFQTWGGTRSPESRITDNLGPIRSEAREGDVFIFQRAADSLDQFRFLLIRRRSQDYSELSRSLKNRRWGAVFEDEQPITESDLVRAAHELDALANEPFSVKSGERRRIESRQSRLARSAAFPAVIKREYGNTCSVSGFSLATPSMMYEVQAAHVVPVSEGGTEDVRNGLALAQTLHWAFDRGLFGITRERTVFVPHRVRRMRVNNFLRRFHGRRIREANTNRLRVHQDALAWHFEQRVGLWN